MNKEHKAIFNALWFTGAFFTFGIFAGSSDEKMLWWELLLAGALSVFMWPFCVGFLIGLLSKGMLV